MYIVYYEWNEMHIRDLYIRDSLWMQRHAHATPMRLYIRKDTSKRGASTRILFFFNHSFSYTHTGKSNLHSKLRVNILGGGWQRESAERDNYMLSSSFSGRPMPSGDMTHSCVCHDSFICVTWLIHADSCICVTLTHAHMWHDALMCVTWLIHMCDTTHAHRSLLVNTILFWRIWAFPSVACRSAIGFQA